MTCSKIMLIACSFRDHRIKSPLLSALVETSLSSVGRAVAIGAKGTLQDSILAWDVVRSSKFKTEQSHKLKYNQICI